MKKSGSQRVESASRLPASRLIDARIQELADWRGEMLARLRALIKQADPEVVEEWKWETPVWSHGGLISTGETYKKAVKLTFARGALLDDPAGLFNSSLKGRVRRAIDFHEGDKVNEKALIRAAVADAQTMEPQEGARSRHAGSHDRGSRPPHGSAADGRVDRATRLSREAGWRAQPDQTLADRAPRAGSSVTPGLSQSHHCCTPKPPPSRCIFLKKMTPCTLPEMAPELRNRSI